MRGVENPADSLAIAVDVSGADVASVFVLFRLQSWLYNFICAGFQPLWG